MNRQQRRNFIRMVSKKQNCAKPGGNNAAALTQARDPAEQTAIDGLPTVQIVAGINQLLSQLQSRGIEVMDWDHHDQQLFRLQMRRDKVYYLAADEEMKPQPAGSQNQ